MWPQPQRGATQKALAVSTARSCGCVSVRSRITAAGRSSAGEGQRFRRPCVLRKPLGRAAGPAASAGAGPAAHCAACADALGVPTARWEHGHPQHPKERSLIQGGSGREPGEKEVKYCWTSGPTERCLQESTSATQKHALEPRQTHFQPALPPQEAARGAWPAQQGISDPQARLWSSASPVLVATQHRTWCQKQSY